MKKQILIIGSFILAGVISKELSKELQKNYKGELQIWASEKPEKIPTGIPHKNISLVAVYADELRGSKQHMNKFVRKHKDSFPEAEFVLITKNQPRSKKTNSKIFRILDLEKSLFNELLPA